MGSKSERLQRRYRSLLKDQCKLDALGFNKASASRSPTHGTANNDDNADLGEDVILLPNIKEEPAPERIPSSNMPICPAPQLINDDVIIRQETPDPPALNFESDVAIRQESMTPPPLFFEGDNAESDDVVRIRQESMTPPPLLFVNTRKRKATRLGDTNDDSGSDSEMENDEPALAQPQTPADILADDRLSGEDSWEDEIDEALVANSEIQDWKTLRTQIKDDLKKKHKSLALSEINQLMVLRNFSTLRLKGYGKIQASMEIANQWQEKDGSNAHLARRIRILARHYQVFEQLPRERRGGYRNSRSLLKDEIVRTASRTWLTEQPIGSITPTKFMHALNTTILPTLGMLPNKPLCERTARRWLVKLGWTRTVLRKGVYMDGHERADVVEYREEVFLPKMKEFERRMARYEGPDLKRVEPDLRPGEKELIAEFQDESCCSGNDYQTSAWYASTSFSSHLVRTL